MEKIQMIIDWVRAIPGGDVGLLIASIIGVASVIVKMTPTPKDDEILGKIKKVISKWIALN